MPRYRAVYDNRGLKYEVEGDNVIYWRGDDTETSDAPMVMRDIGEYQSMIDGTVITSRSVHREHLKRHGCIEVGNEKMEAPKVTVQGQERRREFITRRMADMSDKQANQILSQLRSEYGR